MIVKITAHRTSTDVVVVHAGPELAEFMGAFPAARWQPAAKAYWLPVEQLDAFGRYARIKDHVLVDDRAKGPAEKFTGPLPECTACGQAAGRAQALALNRCPRCGAVWRPVTHTDAGPVATRVECPGCGRRQHVGFAFCGGCGAPMPSAPAPGPRPPHVPRPKLEEPALFGDLAEDVAAGLEPDHMQRAAGDR